MIHNLNLCVIFFLVLSSAYGQDEVEEENPLEALCAEHTEPWGFVAVPHQCNAWVACRGSEFVTDGVCDESIPFNFDHNNGECNWIGCHQNIPSFECGVTQFPATLHAHVLDCTKYYSCQFGVVTEATCPAGQHFDGTACAAGATCESPCTGLGAADAPEMIPDPTDCNKFLVCVGGELMVHPECPPDQFFDNHDKECMDCYYAHCTLTDPTNENIARDQCTKPADGTVMRKNGKKH